MRNESYPWQPIAGGERLAALDIVRGLALLGVLLVNADSGFRVSLFEHIFTFHSHPDWGNRLMDVLLAGLFEFKAFALFSLLFGVGIGVQAERAASRSLSVWRFLVRRFSVLLAIGLGHMFLIWNGDILVLYAVCGLLLIPFLRLSSALLSVLGIGAIALPLLLPWGGLWQSEEVLRAHAAEATRIYSEGSWGGIQALRWREAWWFILPLLIGSLPKTFGLMLLGVAAWRAGVVREPERNQGLLWVILIGAGTVGGITTSLLVYSESSGRSVHVSRTLLEVGSHVPLALAYAAGLFLWLRSPRTGLVISSLAAVGQLALSNYVTQSVILGFVFYSYGLGLFGQLGSAPVALVGLAIYVVQLAVSRAWLLRYRFGPLEWLWRSLTYGRWQAIRLSE